MESKEIRKLISGGENGSVEFKKKANHPDKIVREVVAFANSKGGHLFIGVSDDCTISGLKYPEDDEFVLTKAILELCRPSIGFEVATRKLNDGKKILHYQIGEGKQKPYYAFLQKEHRYGKAFIRVGDRSIQASNEMRRFLREIQHYNKPIRYEESIGHLFKFFKENTHITLSQYCEFSGLNKKLASKKLVSLALSGALKIEPREGEDLFIPVH